MVLRSLGCGPQAYLYRVRAEGERNPDTPEIAMEFIPTGRLPGAL